MSHAPTAWKLDFVLLAAIWGASFLFMRMGAVELGVMPTAGLRVGIASVFLLPLLLARGLGQVLRHHWKPVLVVGILNSAIPIVCFSYALLSITTGLTAILNATTPLFGAVIAWLWLKDKPNGSRILGLAIGFIGVALLAWDKASFKPDASGASSGWAVLACLLATLCYGLSASFTKRYLGQVPSLVSATGSQLGASVGLLPLTCWFWPDHAVSVNAWLAVTFAIPVFALLYGVVLLGEVVTPWMVLCGLVIVAGTGLSTGLVRFSRK